MSLIFAVLSSTLAGVAYAHGVEPERAAASEAAFVVAACLTAALTFYAVGVVHVWQSAGFGRGIRTRAAICFVTACVMLTCAVFGPLDALAQGNFAWHMAQHELLMVVVAPLFVLGRPLGAWSWTFPHAARRRIGRMLRAPWVARPWRWLTAPITAWSLHGMALWLWHVPVVFRAAAADETLHALQHASFLATALLFWWAVLRSVSTRPGVGMLVLFTTMVHTGALGALLVFSPTEWYALDGAADSLDAQHLGGLLMWIPGGTVYLVAALAIAYRLLSPGRRQETGKPVQLSGTS